MNTLAAMVSCGRSIIQLPPPWAEGQMLGGSVQIWIVVYHCSTQVGAAGFVLIYIRGLESNSLPG